MEYNIINVSLESFSLVVCFILFVFQLSDKKKTKTDFWFCLIILSNSLMLVGDICDRIWGGIPGKGIHHLNTAVALIGYYVASGIMLLSIFGWIYYHIKEHEDISKIWMNISVVLTGLHTLISLTLPFTKICYYDASNNYCRGDLFAVTQIVPYIVLFLTFAIMFKYHKAFDRRESIYLAFFCVFPLLAEISQLIDANISAFNVAISVGLLVLTTFIQIQRDYQREEQIRELALIKNEELEKLTRRQEDLNFQLIDVLCKTVEAKDKYTRGHSLRVAQYAREIMYRMGGDEAAQQEVYSIGILHDVGKISVRDEIINKNGRLTDDEYEQIKLHTVAGYQILRGVDLIPDLAVGARWHHERYDGKGYPNGLSGENIPLVARIISVADAYDAMTSNRSYHTVMAQSDVREQIVQGMGTQFDPKIAQIMLDMMDEDLQYDMRQMNYTRITNILLIDDDEFIHNMVEQIFIDENYVFSFASSGEEGIKLLKENRYELCLLDMEMPGMNGFEVLEWIQKNAHGLKVIFLTGDRDINTIRDTERLGAVDYITKPINVRVLKESIQSVLTH